MSVERNLMVSNAGFDDLDAALAWVVQVYDREFTGAQMVKLAVEQHLESTDSGYEWRSVWSATVSGMTEEPR